MMAVHLKHVPRTPVKRDTVILRSRALARRLEGRPLGFVAHPSRLAAKGGEHLRMTGILWRHG
jgi:hypothetical protein